MVGHTGIFCTKAEIDTKVGKNVLAAGYTEAAINLACIRAESVINAICRYNFSDAYVGANADLKGILSEAESSWVALQFIAYDMSVYTSRIEAEDMINLNYAIFHECMKTLKDPGVVDFVKKV